MEANERLKTMLIDMIDCARYGKRDWTHGEMFTYSKTSIKVKYSGKDDPCIYLITAAESDKATHPDAIYIGKSNRNAFVRFGEHKRRTKTNCDKALDEIWNSDACIKLYVMSAPIEALDELEGFGMAWISSNVTELKILNTSSAAGGASRHDNLDAAFYSATLKSMGKAENDFQLCTVMDDIVATAQVCTDKMPWLRKLAEHHINLGLQVASKSADGKYHIVAGQCMFLATMLAGEHAAFGTVYVVDESACRDRDFRTVVQEYEETKSVMRQLKSTSKDTYKLIRNIAQSYFEDHCRSDDPNRIRKGFRPWITGSQILSVDPVGKTQVKEKTMKYEKFMAWKVAVSA